MRVVGQSDNIKNTLQSLFNRNYNQIKNLDYNTYVSKLIEENQVFIDKTTGNHVFWLDESDINLLKKSLKNFKLATLFSLTTDMNIDKENIKLQLKNELINATKKLNSKNKNTYNDLKRQAMFIIYGDYPKAWCSIYGKGHFPVLKEPEYFDYDYSNELLIHGITIDFSTLWKNLIDLETLIDELDLYNQLVNDSDIFDAIVNSYKYKTFLILNEIFNENKNIIFSELNVEKPFYVFGNEHDCESINLYLFE